MATARAGNVIGGGDFAEDRIVPDIWRAAREGKPLVLRNPNASRPWQHVLDPLAGYFRFAERLAAQSPGVLPPALNFGPREQASVTVAALAEQLQRAFGNDVAWEQAAEPGPPEKQTLALDASRARQVLGWQAKLDTASSIAWTAEWYRAFDAGEDVAALMQRQVERYEALP